MKNFSSSHDILYFVILPNGTVDPLLCKLKQKLRFRQNMMFGQSKGI